MIDKNKQLTSEEIVERQLNDFIKKQKETKGNLLRLQKLLTKELNDPAGTMNKRFAKQYLAHVETGLHAVSEAWKDFDFPENASLEDKLKLVHKKMKSDELRQCNEAFKVLTGDFDALNLMSFIPKNTLALLRDEAVVPFQKLTKYGITFNDMVKIIDKAPEDSALHHCRDTLEACRDIGNSIATDFNNEMKATRDDNLDNLKKLSEMDRKILEHIDTKLLTLLEKKSKKYKQEQPVVAEELTSMVKAVRDLKLAYTSGNINLHDFKRRMEDIFVQKRQGELAHHRGRFFKAIPARIANSITPTDSMQIMSAISNLTQKIGEDNAAKSPGLSR